MSEETTQENAPFDVEHQDVVLHLPEEGTDEVAEEEASEESEDVEEGTEKKKKKSKRVRVVNLEMLKKKFKSPIQGKQRKVQDWEDRTAKRLKDLGFRNVPIAQRTAEFCTFELTLGTIRAVIKSEHSNWSSRGVVKFTDSAPAPVVEESPAAEPTVESTQEAA